MLSDSERKILFDAAKRRGAVFKTRADVADYNGAVDEVFAIVNAPAQAAPASTQEAPPPVTGRSISPKGIALIHSFEQCKLAAYPDPGSKDGNPWTIGWGSTGADIRRGTVWTQEQADARFARDIADFSAKVWNLVKDVPTTQSQFDSFCSLAYNIGIGAFSKSTVLRKHKAGDHTGAARAFLMWNKNNGAVMRGLTRRRLAESELYSSVA